MRQFSAMTRRTTAWECGSAAIFLKLSIDKEWFPSLNPLRMPSGRVRRRPAGAGRGGFTGAGAVCKAAAPDPAGFSAGTGGLPLPG
ncbi:MAG: hypothetical protein BroJett030_10880 [Alphaproteobacteria bacterium]|nr:MAG: hypothetical protein BroJett030_10880 [Alphaproteobacteria bacterium]